MRRASTFSHRLTLAAMAALGIWGLLLTVLPLQPFWIDEWRFIFNLKFLSWERLWGPMRYTQQCPRLYLALLKTLNAPFQYSYTALRMPALLLSLASMLLAWRMMRRLFPDKDDWLPPLFVLVIVSSQTFTTYLVQTKHYEAEIFLALVAMWQCLEMAAIADGVRLKASRYILLCATLAGAPFFSYTYPVAIAPALLLAGIAAIRQREKLSRLALPLLLSIAGIAFFYLTDVRQLMRDEAMHSYWAYRMATGGVGRRLENLWYFFATVGPGALFEVIFGVLGIGGFVYGMLRASGKTAPAQNALSRWMAAYAVLLVLLVMALSVTGRLPAGEAKFSAFCVPALALLIVSLLHWLRCRYRVATAVLGIILFAELAGNIISVVYNFHTAAEYGRRMHIYRATQAAIARAQAHNLPILVTPGVAWPDEIVHKVPFLENMTADAVLKTWPAYPSKDGVPVYAIPDVEKAKDAFPVYADSAVIGDGVSYRSAGSY